MSQTEKLNTQSHNTPKTILRKNEQGDIHQLVRDNCVKKLRDLLNSKTVNLDAKDAEGNTALHIAAASGNTECVLALLAEGAKANVENNAGNTPLHLVCASGNMESAEALLAEEGVDVDVNAVGVDGSTPLHLVIKRGDLIPKKQKDFIQLLIKYQANINAKNTRNGLTPLHVAGAEGNIEVVRFLLEKGAVLDIKDNNGKSPLLHTIEQATTRLKGVSRGAQGKRKNYGDCITELLKSEQALTMRDNGLHPIHMLASYGWEEHISALLQRGVDINTKTDTGSTSLHLVLSPEKKNVSMAKFLVDNKADKNVSDNTGRTPLNYVQLYVAHNHKNKTVEELQLLEIFHCEVAPTKIDSEKTSPNKKTKNKKPKEKKRVSCSLPASYQSVLTTLQQPNITVVSKAWSPSDQILPAITIDQQRKKNDGNKDEREMPVVEAETCVGDTTAFGVPICDPQKVAKMFPEMSKLVQERSKQRLYAKFNQRFPSFTEAKAREFYNTHSLFRDWGLSKIIRERQHQSVGVPQSSSYSSQQGLIKENTPQHSIPLLYTVK